MKLKLTEEGYAEVQDGKPVYVNDDGKEITYDPISMHKKIGELNKENQTYREAKEEAEEKIKEFEGIDPEKAAEAMKTLDNLNDKKLVDAGEIEKVKQQAIESADKQWREKYEAEQQKREEIEGKYKSDKINLAFSNSKFVKDQLAVPPDMAQATFGKYFEFDGSRVTPKDPNGNPIYSDRNPGDVADFDEAMEKLVEQYPYRDSIMKGTGNRGSGAEGVEGDPNVRVMSRKQFEAMDPGKQGETAKAIDEGKVKLQD